MALSRRSGDDQQPRLRTSGRGQREVDAADESAGLDAVSVSRNGENGSETMSGLDQRNIN